MPHNGKVSVCDTKNLALRLMAVFIAYRDFLAALVLSHITKTFEQLGPNTNSSTLLLPNADTDMPFKRFTYSKQTSLSKPHDVISDADDKLPEWSGCKLLSFALFCHFVYY